MEDLVLADKLARLDVRRICLIKPSAFGDVVQTLPLLSVLRRRFPAAKISWVINRELRDLLTGHPDLHEIIPFERRGGWRAWWTLLSTLRSRRFDLVFDMQGLLRTGVMTAASGAILRVGLESAREGSHWACNHQLMETGRLVPAHARYWRVAEALGLGTENPTALFNLPEEALSWSKQFLAETNGPLLAIHPGARWATKQWPVAHFAEVAIRAASELGFSLVAIGGPGERPACEELVRLIADQTGNASGIQVRNLAGQTSLKQLAALLQRCSLVLSNDSGPMHLAAAVQTPVVGVFTCTSPARSGPPGGLHAFATTSLPCAASYCKVCPHKGMQHLECFRELTSERVWDELKLHWQQLEERGRILRAA